MLYPRVLVRFKPRPIWHFTIHHENDWFDLIVKVSLRTLIKQVSQAQHCLMIIRWLSTIFTNFEYFCFTVSEPMFHQFWQNFDQLLFLQWLALVECSKHFLNISWKFYEHFQKKQLISIQTFAVLQVDLHLSSVTAVETQKMWSRGILHLLEWVLIEKQFDSSENGIEGIQVGK